jgi:hypothetical protein
VLVFRVHDDQRVSADERLFYRPPLVHQHVRRPDRGQEDERRGDADQRQQDARNQYTLLLCVPAAITAAVNRKKRYT